MKDVVISFLVGFFLGVVSVLVWVFSDGVDVKRKTNGKDILRKVVKSVSGISGVPVIKRVVSAGGGRRFFLGFEDKNSFSFFQLSDGLYVELTDEKFTEGQHSLFMEFPQGAKYPGLYWEVYRRDKCLDWSGWDVFGFDIFNNSDRKVQITIKIKSGPSYPKKSFEKKVLLEPKSWTQVRIPIGELARYIDVKQISYIKMFVPSPKLSIELFLDKLGIFKDRGIDTTQEKAEAAVNYGFKWGFVNPIEKVIPVRSYLRNKIKIHSSYVIELAKGEKEGVQLVLFDVCKDKKIKIKVVSSNGESAEGIDVNVFMEKFVKTKRPYYRVTYVGKWPDPVIEIDDSTYIQLKRQQIYVFWIDFSASNIANPNEFDFEVQIEDESGEPIVSIPIKVKVWQFSIPKTSSLRTAFDVYDEFFAPFFPRKKGEDYRLWKERIKRIKMSLFEMLLDYRVSAMMRIDPMDEGMIEWLKTMKKRGLTGFCIGKYGGSFGNNWPKDERKLDKLVDLYRDYAHRLRNASLLDIAYIYTWDEGKIGDPFVAKVCSMIHRADPDLKNMVCYHGFWDPDVLKGWGDDIDIWCFQIASYNRILMKKLQDYGMQIWVYVSGPDGETPNLAIDSLGIEHRILPWIIWEKKISGLLYWAVNFWRGGDPWKNTFNTPWQQNGNGLLCYPYEDRIVPTVRLFMLRDGIEDYEYLKMLEKYGQREDIDMSLRQEIKRLLNMSVLFDSFRRYTKNSQQLLERRHKIGELLDKICGGFEEKGK